MTQDGDMWLRFQTAEPAADLAPWCQILPTATAMTSQKAEESFLQNLQNKTTKENVR